MTDAVNKNPTVSPLSDQERPLASLTGTNDAHSAGAPGQTSDQRPATGRSVTLKDVSDTLFIALEAADLGFQLYRDITETQTSVPFPEIPGLNVNTWRPDKSEHPVASGIASGFELANVLTMDTRRTLINFFPPEEPRVLAQNEEGFTVLLANQLLVPVHAYNNTTQSLASPYLWQKDGALDWGISAAYALAYGGRLLNLPVESLDRRTSLNAGLGCTPETVERFAAYYNFDSLTEATAACADEQKNNAIDWLADSNDPQEQENNLDIPHDEALGTMTWSLKRAANGLAQAEFVSANLGFFQAIEGNDSRFGVPTAVGLAALPTTELLLAHQAGYKLDAGAYALTIGGTLLGAGQAVTTDNPAVARAYARQNLIFGLETYLPGNYAALYDADASGQSRIARTANFGSLLSGAGVHALGGASYGVALAEGDTCEKVGLTATMALGQGMHAVNTGKFWSQGEARVLIPWSIKSGLFASTAIVGHRWHDKKLVSFLAGNVDVEAGDGAVRLAVSGQW